MLSEADLVKYVPEVDDNRDQPQESQWTVDFYPMTAAEQRTISLGCIRLQRIKPKSKKSVRDLAPDIQGSGRGGSQPSRYQGEGNHKWCGTV